MTEISVSRPKREISSGTVFGLTLLSLGLMTMKKEAKNEPSSGHEKNCHFDISIAAFGSTEWRTDLLILCIPLF